LTTLRVLLALAIPLSLVHYTDNYLAFERYPESSLLGVDLTKDAIWAGWLVYTAGGLLGYALYRRGEIATACALIAFYSISGLISIGHYAEPGMSELAWWRHLFIWVDITLGAAVLAFAVWAWARARRLPLAAWSSSATPDQRPR
jgi:hypothetical protein